MRVFLFAEWMDQKVLISIRSLLPALIGSVLVCFLAACHQKPESGTEADFAALPISGAVEPNRERSLFVSPSWLMAHKESIHSGDVILVEVLGFGAKPSGRHIQGAVGIGTDEIEREPLWNLVSDAELLSVFESNGLVWNRTTVFYGKDPFAVARMIWAASYAGVEDVRWLWSGLRGWSKAGGELQSSFVEVKPSVFGRPVPSHPEFSVSTAELKGHLNGGTAEVVSVRSRREFEGIVSGYSYIESKGHIEGALWGGSASGWIHRDLQRTLDRARKDLAAASKDPTRSLIFYCGTGWRSSMAFLMARELGYESIANYDGSWLEWTRDEVNPVK